MGVLGPICSNTSIGGAARSYQPSVVTGYLVSLSVVRNTSSRCQQCCVVCSWVADQESDLLRPWALTGRDTRQEQRSVENRDSVGELVAVTGQDDVAGLYGVITSVVGTVNDDYVGSTPRQIELFYFRCFSGSSCYPFDNSIDATSEEVHACDHSNSRTVFGVLNRCPFGNHQWFP